jgi:two-component sensor histidine kinase
VSGSREHDPLETIKAEMTAQLKGRIARVMDALTPSARRLRWIERLPIARDRPALAVCVTLTIVAAAFVLRMATDSVLPSGFPYVTFFPAVIVTSFVFGARLGVVSAMLCGVLAWYFFIPPTHSFALTRSTIFALSFYVFVVATDLALVHAMQVANRELARERELSRTLADTRELLFRELQHRVSNNLQVVAGLLAMQRRTLDDPKGKAALDEATRRLALIARISRQIYDPSGLAQPLAPFLADLCQAVVEASGRDDLSLRVLGDDQLRLLPEAAISTALVVAEAVANSIEHGFRDGRAGTIVVSVVPRSKEGASVTIHDDGHGLPDDFVHDDAASLGLRIATTLARGQGGRFYLEQSDGTLATLDLPAALLAQSQRAA